MLVLVRSFSYIPHTDHSEDVLKHFARWFGENLLLHRGAHLVLELGHAFLLYCNSNDYTEIIPDVIHCPNKDARARSDRLQLGTAHIQSFTQASVGCHGYDSVLGCYRLLASAVHAQGAAATDTPRLASSSVQTDPTAQS